MAFALPSLVRVRWQKQHRIIATRYPPIPLFERAGLNAHQLRALHALQARTNPRLMQAAGTLHLVRDEDIVTGPNASIVMAAFTHIGFPSRFTDGSYGVYYGSRTLETAIRETAYHRERDAHERQLKPQEFEMRAYTGKVVKPMYELRVTKYAKLLHGDDYSASQQFARQVIAVDPDAWGMVFHSARHPGGESIAAFRPPALSLPVTGPLLSYQWNGERITTVFEKQGPLLFL
ncbi:MAG TPA: RES family NAD+ phosphorylase [Gammaproteobacteria bacterium]